MNKFVKYALIATAAAVLVSAAIATYLVATFDPNTYKPQLVEWVKERTHRTLTIPGEIKLTLFPPVGLTLGKVTLSEPDSDTVFASIDELRVALGLMPLLKKKLRMEDVHIQGLQANLLRDAEGRLNAADLLGTARTAEKAPEVGVSGAPPSVAADFDIKSISLANGALTYHDQKSKASYSVSGLNLKTGRIAGNQPSSIDVSARVQGDRPKMDLAARLQSAFTFDLPADRYSLKNVAIEAKGEAGGISNFAAKAEGSVDGALKTPATDARDVTLTATGNRQGDAFEVDIALPRLRLMQEGVSGDKLVVKLARRNEGVTLNAQLSAPKLEGGANAFKIADAVLDLDASRAGQTLKVTVTGPVEGRFLDNTLEPAHVSVNPLSLQAVLSGEDIPNQSVTGALKGSAAVDFAPPHAQVELAGSFDQSTIRAKVGVVGFSPPGYSFDVEIDRLDLTRYQQRKPAPAPAPPAKPGPEPPIDLSALKNLNANGSVRIGILIAPKLKASNVRIEVKAHDSRIDIDPLAANLYGGSLTGVIGVNALGTPQFTVKQDLAGVNIGPLLVDLANFERLEGRGNFSVNVSTAGTTLTELKKGLNGMASAHLADGAIKGINIAATIRQAKATIARLKGKQQTEVADTTQVTEFTELKATFNILHGIASNRDLSGKSPVLRLAGEGDIDLGNDRMNYLLKANLVESITGQSGKERIQVADITVPVRVTGPLNAPSYSFDFATMAADLAQQALQEELQKKLGSKLPEGLPGDILQDAVKGLFKR